MATKSRRARTAPKRNPSRDEWRDRQWWPTLRPFSVRLTPPLDGETVSHAAYQQRLDQLARLAVRAMPVVAAATFTPPATSGPDSAVRLRGELPRARARASQRERPRKAERDALLNGRVDAAWTHANLHAAIVASYPAIQQHWRETRELVVNARRELKALRDALSKLPADKSDRLRIEAAFSALDEFANSFAPAGCSSPEDVFLFRAGGELDDDEIAAVICAVEYRSDRTRGLDAVRSRRRVIDQRRQTLAHARRAAIDAAARTWGTDP